MPEYYERIGLPMALETIEVSRFFMPLPTRFSFVLYTVLYQQDDLGPQE